MFETNLDVNVSKKDEYLVNVDVYVNPNEDNPFDVHTVYKYTKDNKRIELENVSDKNLKKLNQLLNDQNDKDELIDELSSQALEDYMYEKGAERFESRYGSVDNWLKS